MIWLKFHLLFIVSVTLFEYDRRFAAYGSDFIMYDYKSPLDIPRDRNSYYDLVIADPPFLSEECLTKTSVTMRYLSKKKLILCTGNFIYWVLESKIGNNLIISGAIMSDLAKRLLDIDKCKFEPKHRNNLANEFWCFSNYDVDSLMS